MQTPEDRLKMLKSVLQDKDVVKFITPKEALSYTYHWVRMEMLLGSRYRKNRALKKHCQKMNHFHAVVNFRIDMEDL